jgi:hypothetical protein
VGEVPLLKELYSKYHGQDFELISISIDTDRKAFESMVAAKKMTWPQLMDGKGAEGQVPRLFNLRGTPTLYLIDPEGKIAAKERSAEAVSKILAARLQK